MNKLEIDIQCPSCGRKIKQRVDRMHSGASRRCLCGCNINFTGDDGRKVQRELDKFERDLNKLFR